MKGVDNPKVLLIDFETQSLHPIYKAMYTSAQDTRILCMSWGFKGGKGAVWWPGQPCPKEIVTHVLAEGLIGASYAEFDQDIWDFIAVEDHEFPPTKQTQWFCTQAQSRVSGLPSALDKSARALGSKQRKDSYGRTLINRCCIPPFSEDPQDYADLGAYCLQDWVVMDHVARQIPELTPTALEDYHFNTRMTQRGVKIDRSLAQAAANYAEQERGEINEKIFEVTCGAVEKSTQSQRFKNWLKDCLEDDGDPDAIALMVKHVKGEKKFSVDKTVRANILAACDAGELPLAPDIREALTLMDDAGGSATSKFAKMLQISHPEDDRVRHAIRYAGAPATQRASSVGLQVHNFRRDAFSPSDAEFYKRQMLRGDDLVDREGQPVRVMDTLGKLLRSAIIPEEGKVFVVGDWNAVESRKTAYLAGQEDKLTMFREGGEPYCHAASLIYGRQITPEDVDERQIGKVVDLACGFLGGPGALQSMATMFRLHIPVEKRKGIVDKYRRGHPGIVTFGDKLQRAALNALKRPGKTYSARGIEYTFNSEDRALYCRLLDGETVLRYPECRVEMDYAPWDKDKLQAKIPKISSLQASFTPAADAKEWARHGLWRGLFLENVVQASCAKLLRDACINCEEEGLDVIFHVHDEIVLEVPESAAGTACRTLTDIMNETPSWCPGMPLKAKPKVMARYGK